VSGTGSIRDAFWRVAVVEDHRLQRLRTEQLLNDQSGLSVVHSCETLPELMEWMRSTTVRTRPHLVVLDLMVDRGEDVRPKHVAELVRSGARVMVLSALSSPSLVRDVIGAGVHGIVSKRDSEADVIAATWAVLDRRRWITDELAQVFAGGPARPRLSDQEERAMVLYASGHTVEAVAAAIGVKHGTAKKYLERVKRKYAEVGRPVHSKLDMSREALRDGLIDPGT